MIVFDHIPKTAGTTFKFILRNSFGIFHCDAGIVKKKTFTQKDLRLARRIFFQIRSISGHNLVNPPQNLEGRDHFYVTILREPVKRYLSHYQDMVMRGSYDYSLHDWMGMDEHTNLQVKQIAGSEDVDRAREILREQFSFVGLTERFDESMRLLKVMAPYPLNLDYKRKVVAKSNHIKNAILEDPEKVDLVRRHNSLDVELYRYVSEELFPAYVEKYASAMKGVPSPRPRYKTHRTWKYQASRFYNKFVYSFLLKLSGRKR